MEQGSLAAAGCATLTPASSRRGGDAPLAVRTRPLSPSRRSGGRICPRRPSSPSSSFPSRGSFTAVHADNGWTSAPLKDPDNPRRVNDLLLEENNPTGTDQSRTPAVRPEEAAPEDGDSSHESATRGCLSTTTTTSSLPSSRLLRSSFRHLHPALAAELGDIADPAPFEDGGDPLPPVAHRRFAGPIARRRWHLLVGMLALLDAAASGSWSWKWRGIQEWECGAAQEKLPHRRWRGLSRSINARRRRPGPEVPTADGTLVAWLALRRDVLSALFSLAWLVDALVVAASDVANAKEEKGGGGRRSSRSSWVRFLRVLAVQLLLLPVGLYQRLYRLCGFSGTAPAWVEEPWSGVGSDDDESMRSCLASASHYSRRSVAMVLFAGAAARLWKAGHALHLSGLARVQAFAVRTVVANLHRPRHLLRAILDALRLVRWVRCLLPVAGAVGNLAGRVRDLRMRRRQRREAEEARRRRRKELQRLPSDEVRERCACRLQAAYRARRARIATLTLRDEPEARVAFRLRAPLRASLDRARRRLCEKRQFVERLRDLQAQLQRQRKEQDWPWEPPSLEDRKYLYRLERELRDEALRLLNHTLLVSPHSRFAAVWNAIMVAGAAAEMAALALALSSSRSLDGRGRGTALPPDTANRAALRTALARRMVPRPWVELPPCRPEARRDDSWSSLRRLPFSRRPEPKPRAALPWYCAPALARVQGRLAGEVLLQATLLVLRLLEAASGADAVVKVFTAEVGDPDPSSGLLRPPPAFRRWILPGLLMQLLVNPQLEAIRGVSYRAALLAIEHGPYRVLGWAVALLYPLMRWAGQAALQAWIRSQAAYAVQLEAEAAAEGVVN